MREACGQGNGGYTAQVAFYDYALMFSELPKLRPSCQFLAHYAAHPLVLQPLPALWSAPKSQNQHPAHPYRVFRLHASVGFGIPARYAVWRDSLFNTESSAVLSWGMFCLFGLRGVDSSSC